MNLIIEQLKNFTNTKDTLTFLCNASALLKEYFEDTNWLGFYLLKDNQLHLGPFQGKVACELIDIGKGVCGTSIKEKKVLNVANVHEFKGHIACDSASNSEIVLPLIYNDQIYGVLDIDSTKFNRFSKEDEELLTEISNIISKRIAKENDE